MVNFDTTRRSLIRTAALGVGLGGLSTTAAAKQSGNGGKEGLEDDVAEFAIFATNAPTEGFGYPDSPVIGGIDPDDSNDPPQSGLFDANEIKKTPNGETLHHTLQFFQGMLMRKKHGKPYVLRHQGEGRFESRGQHVNFESQPTSKLKGLIQQAKANLEDTTRLEYLLPLLEEGSHWRGVGRDIVQFEDSSKESRVIDYALTRVDFYSQGRGKPKYETSLVYVITKLNKSQDHPVTQLNKDVTELLNAERANPGGQ